MATHDVSVSHYLLPLILAVTLCFPLLFILIMKTRYSNQFKIQITVFCITYNPGLQKFFSERR